VRSAACAAVAAGRRPLSSARCPTPPGVRTVATSPATNSLLMVAMAVIAAVFLRHVESPPAQPEPEPVAAPAPAPQLALDPA
jgi:hypothetical protein